MTNEKPGRFQSGREVFEEYIPDYVSQSRSTVAEDYSWEYRSSAQAVAETILTTFRERLASLGSVEPESLIKE